MSDSSTASPEAGIMEYLNREGAVFTNSHFVYTDGDHGTAYISLRRVAIYAPWMLSVGQLLGQRLAQYRPEIIIGSETLGRNLAGYAGLAIPSGKAMWCVMKEDKETGRKWAEFPPKLGFEDWIPGEAVGVVDDLLTTGSTIRRVVELIEANGGTVVAAGAVVRRSADITAENCGVAALEQLVDLNLERFTPQECATVGPCSRRQPVVARTGLGHGHEWIERPENADYPWVAWPTT